MLTLYVKTGCLYCTTVVEELKKLGIEYEEKNIVDPAIAKELIAKGGKRRVPFMDDEDPCESAKHHTPCLIDNEVEMYESEDIVRYLKENYGSSTSAGKDKKDVPLRDYT